jgi:hypothetical protein
MDRRKSYVDVIERVLGASKWPDYRPPVFRMATPGGLGLLTVLVRSSIVPDSDSHE